MPDPKPPSELALETTERIHRLIYLAAKWYHLANNWGSYQGSRNRDDFPDEDRASPWRSVFDELDDDVNREIEAALAEQRKRIALRICPNCDVGAPLERFKGGWYHIGIPCWASGAWEEGERDGDR